MKLSKPEICYIFTKKGRSRKIKRIVREKTNGTGIIFYEKKRYPVRFVKSTGDEPGYWTQDMSSPVASVTTGNVSIIEAEVVSIGDGDTLRVKCQQDFSGQFSKGEVLTIRLAWIDAPESDQLLGTDARNKLIEFAPKNSIAVVRIIKKDLYNRFVGEIFVDGELVNLKMVREGYAVVYTRYLSGCPNSDEFLRAGSLAKWHQINFWLQSNPIMPWEFREQKHQKQQAKRKLTKGN